MLFCIVVLLGPVMLGSYLLKSYEEAKDKRAWAKEVLTYIAVLILMIAMFRYMYLVASTMAARVIAQM